MPNANLNPDGWEIEQTDAEKRPFLDRLLHRNRPRLLTVQEMGGPEPRPLIAGRFAGPDLSLEAYLAGQNDRDVMPGHDPGAVEQWRRDHAPGTFPGVREE